METFFSSMAVCVPVCMRRRDTFSHCELKIGLHMVRAWKRLLFFFFFVGPYRKTKLFCNGYFFSIQFHYRNAVAKQLVNSYVEIK